MKRALTIIVAALALAGCGSTRSATLSPLDTETLDHATSVLASYCTNAVSPAVGAGAINTILATYRQHPDVLKPRVQMEPIAMRDLMSTTSKYLAACGHKADADRVAGATRGR